jgi:DNA-directed RNA polymerase subunit RPC12/RpoP
MAKKKVGRPRGPLSTLTKEAAWKRWQRESPGGGKCVDCGKKVSGRNAHRDHKDGNQKNQKASNRAIRCRACHMSKGRKSGEI